MRRSTITSSQIILNLLYLPFFQALLTDSVSMNAPSLSFSIIQTFFLVIKCRRHLCKQITYFQMLRTYSLTFSTFDTVRCPSVTVSGYDVVVIISGVPVMKGIQLFTIIATFNLSNPVSAGERTIMEL